LPPDGRAPGGILAIALRNAACWLSDSRSSLWRAKPKPTAAITNVAATATNESTPISREAARIHFAGVGRVNFSDGGSGRFVQGGSQPRGREPAGSALVSCTGSAPSLRCGVGYRRYGAPFKRWSANKVNKA
jgi:hypothetical protein